MNEAHRRQAVLEAALSDLRLTVQRALHRRQARVQHDGSGDRVQIIQQKPNPRVEPVPAGPLVDWPERERKWYEVVLDRLKTLRFWR